MTAWIIAGALCAGAVAGWAIVRGGTMKPTPPITLRMEDGQEHHLAPPVTIDVSGLQTRLERAEADLATAREEATVLLDSIFQTVDPEDGEAIVAEAFPTGAPQWALDWYAEHPSEEEFDARTRKDPHA